MGETLSQLPRRERRGLSLALRRKCLESGSLPCVRIRDLGHAMPGWVLGCREAVVQADPGGTFASPVSRPEATLSTAPPTFCRSTTTSRVFVVQAVVPEHLVYMIEHSCCFVKKWLVRKSQQSDGAAYIHSACSGPERGVRSTSAILRASRGKVGDGDSITPTALAR